MSWGTFNAGCAGCCDEPCKFAIYPHGHNYDKIVDGDTRQYEIESNFYYGLNAGGEPYYNPFTGLTIENHEIHPVQTLQQDEDRNWHTVFGETDGTFRNGERLQDIGVLMIPDMHPFPGRDTCVWRQVGFGFEELNEFLNRGNTIVLVAEWRLCFMGVFTPGRPSGLTIVNDQLAALGVKSIKFNNPGDPYRYGCQLINNANRSNTMNWNVDKISLGGSNTLSLSAGAWPIVVDRVGPPDDYIDTCVIAAEVVNENNGKVVVISDANMLDCKLGSNIGAIWANACELRGLPITPYVNVATCWGRYQAAQDKPKVRNPILETKIPVMFRVDFLEETWHLKRMPSTESIPLAWGTTAKWNNKLYELILTVCHGQEYIYEELNRNYTDWGGLTASLSCKGIESGAECNFQSIIFTDIAHNGLLEIEYQNYEFLDYDNELKTISRPFDTIINIPLLLTNDKLIDVPDLIVNDDAPEMQGVRLHSWYQ